MTTTQQQQNGNYKINQGRNYRETESSKNQNYIPISLLSQTSKIMKRIILKGMKGKEGRLLNIPNELQVMRVIEDLMTYIDEKKTTSIIVFGRAEHIEEIAKKAKDKNQHGKCTNMMEE